MIVDYTKENVWAIGIAMPQVKGKPFASRTVNLIPGINTIDDNDWPKIKDHPMVLMALENKVLIIVTKADADIEKSVEAGVSPQLASLKGKVQEKISVIGKCLNKELLEKWAEEEMSPKIQAALQKQLKVLELTDEEREAMKG